MNLLIYNIYDDSISKIDNLIKEKEAIVHLATSISDVIRILRKYNIDNAIVKLEKKDITVLESVANAYPDICFWISENKRKINNQKNIRYFSSGESLFVLISNIIDSV